MGGGEEGFEKRKKKSTPKIRKRSVLAVSIEKEGRGKTGDWVDARIKAKKR